MFQLSKVPLRFFLCLNIIIFHGLHNAKVIDAAIVYVSQQRHVEASANVDGKSFSDRSDAADFELFDKVLDRSFTYGEGLATGYASQTSSLRTQQITGSGRVSGTTGPPAGSSGGSGNTAMNVNFQIPNRAEYHLEFNVDVLELTSYSLVGPNINHVYNGPPAIPLPFLRQENCCPATIRFRFRSVRERLPQGSREVLTFASLSPQRQAA